MAQFYTLEEAAQRLNLAPEDFKRRLKTEWSSIRPFRDGATLRFRAADIDELARSLGAASDPGLPLGPVGAGLTESSDDFALAPDVPSKKTGSDSDVRLDLATPGKPADGGSGPTEEIALDVSGPPSSGVLKPSSDIKASKSGAKLGKDASTKSGTKHGKDDAAKIPSATDSPSDKTDSSSEFELSLDSDSDSFELQLSSDSSEEVSSLGASDSGRQSGIDLGKPADSGVSLEQKRKGAPPVNDPDSDVDFELSLDPTGASGVRLGGPKSGTPKPKPKGEDSSSEFELTLDDSSGNMDSLAASLQERPEEGKGDIFETDFELPVMEDESGSEVVAVDSDTDLESGGFEVEVGDADADDESASQVVLIDDDAGVLVSDDDDALGGVALADGSSASKALRGVRHDDDDDGAVRTVIAGPAKWGPVPAIALFPTLLIGFFGVLMAFELLQTTKGYSSGTKPGGTITRAIADTLGMKIND